MSKILLIIITSIFSSSLVYSWEHNDNFMESRSLVHSIVNKKKITYCLERNFIPKAGDDKSVLYVEKINSALRKWLHSVNKYKVYDKKGKIIDLDKLEIIPVLPEGSCYNSYNGEVDVVFYFESDNTENQKVNYSRIAPFMYEFNKRTLGHGFVSENYNYAKMLERFTIYRNIGPTEWLSRHLIVLVNTNSEAYSIDEILLHEIGHLFWLNDQYQYEHYSLKSKPFRTENQLKSVMSAEELSEPTCDDITGLLFLFDRSSSHYRVFDTICSEFEKGTYVGGLKEGEWTIKSDKEYEILTANYVAGLRNGKARLVYKDESNQTITDFHNYKNGLLHGKVLSYYSNGNLRFEKHYSNGVLLGKYNIYDIEGNIFADVFHNGSGEVARQYYNHEQEDLMREYFTLTTDEADIFIYSKAYPKGQNKSKREAELAIYYHPVMKKEAYVMNEHKDDEKRLVMSYETGESEFFVDNQKQIGRELPRLIDNFIEEFSSKLSQY